IQCHVSPPPPPALRDYIVRSEVATLMFLGNTGVPDPEVYDFALDHPGNPVGVGFILMEKLPGKSLRWSVATQQQRKKVMDQLADTFVELHKYPFDLLGSLDSPGGTRVGAFARESLVDFVQSEMRTTGPFSSLTEYHTSPIRLVLDLIVRDEMYSQQAVEAYLIHRYLLGLIPHVLPSVPDDGKFYLKHADDKEDHILVDDQFNVTGIIDWEWAHTASPANAFNSPTAFLPVGDFYNSKNSLGDDEVVFARLLEEKGHGDLAHFVWNGRLQHRFAFCCGYDLADWDGFLGLFRGLRDAVGVNEGLDWDEWKAAALRRYEDDPGLKQLSRLFVSFVNHRLPHTTQHHSTSLNITMAPVPTTWSLRPGPRPTRWQKTRREPAARVARWLHALKPGLPPLQPTDDSKPIVVVCISDTHQNQPQIPDGDLLLHAGDLSNEGSFEELQAQLNWLSSLPHKHKVVIAGNHDRLLDPEFVARFPDRICETKGKSRADLVWHDIIYLNGSSVTVEFNNQRKLKIFGSPWTPQFGTFAFQYPPIRDVWTGMIPDRTDIVLTHGPPKGYLDLGGKGCPGLMREVARARPRVMVFGHLHDGRGRVEVGYRRFDRGYQKIMAGRGGVREVVGMGFGLLGAWGGKLKYSTWGRGDGRGRTRTTMINAAVGEADTQGNQSVTVFEM
ncbi:hypothetical protein AK830_g11091, partial [Neonectria ditissima]